MDNFDKTDYIWLCDNCEAVLDEQEGFKYQSVWRCRECGAINYINRFNVKTFKSKDEEDEFWGYKK